MEQTTPPTNMPQNHTKRALVFLTISLIILTLVLLMAYKRGNLSSRYDTITEDVSTTPVPTVDPAITMQLVSASGSTQVAQAEQVTVMLTASSSTRDIVGYDALLKYDHTYFDIVSIRAVDDRYQAIPFKKVGLISVTGTKSPSETDQVMLDNTDLVSLVLQPKKKGTTTISIEAVDGPEQTKMIDATSTVLRPQLSPITLAIY